MNRIDDIVISVFPPGQTLLDRMVVAVWRVRDRLREDVAQHRQARCNQRWRSCVPGRDQP